MRLGDVVAKIFISSRCLGVTVAVVIGCILAVMSSVVGERIMSMGVTYYGPGVSGLVLVVLVYD